MKQHKQQERARAHGQTTHMDMQTQDMQYQGTQPDMQLYRVRPKKCTYFTVAGHHRPPWAYLCCLKDSVMSWWSVVNMVKSWLYGLDLLLIGP